MRSARNVASTITDSVARRGVLGSMRAAMRLALHPILDRQSVIDYRERRFDRRHRVVTAGTIPKERLQVDGPSAAHVTHYQAAQPVVVEQAIAGLGIDFSKYTFVDFGCGKGKAMLLASSFPFERIVGLELSTELAQVAAANVKSYRSRKQRCSAIDVVCMDALAFELPPRPLVCFLYNPFGEAVLRRVIENIGKSLSEHPRDLFVVYVHPELDRLFHDRTFLTAVRKRNWVTLYRSRLEAAAHTPPA